VIAPGDPALRAALARIGSAWSTDIRRYSQEVKDLYEPLLARGPKEGVKVRRDLPYGPHPRQVADVFESGVADAPIVVFVHGGAFVRGNKRTTDEIYGNVLYWFARQGFVGVNLEYRLAPESRYPGGAMDVAAAIDWLSGNAARFGGDPSRIVLVGHSAGGTHVAGYVVDPRVGRFGLGVRAAVLISARLRADVLPQNPNRDGVAAYFGSDPVELERASPIHYVDRSRVPTMVVTAQFENPLLDVYGADFAARLQATRHPLARYRVAQGHNHMSVVAHFNSGEEWLGREILEFFDDASPCA
jgi:acetyl esterase/lipase